MIMPAILEASVDRLRNIEKTVSILTEGLTARTIEVSAFTITDKEKKEKLKHINEADKEYDKSIILRALDCLHISEVFEQADDFDLIHNHLDFLPLSCSGLTATPMLSTIYEPLSSDVMPVYKKFDKKVSYVFDSNVNDFKGLSCAAAINHGINNKNFNPDSMVDAYVNIYKSIIEGNHKGGCRPWGHYTVLSDMQEKRTKFVYIKPGKRLSLQRHMHRHEHWHIIEGEALVTLDGRQINLTVGDSIDIPREAFHRIANNGAKEMMFFEIQSGKYLGEDDIERMEDDYGRT
jgi:mannose-6-phosphate isomerase-like protein (cupin superfamily)